MPQPNFDRVARVYRWAEYLTLGPLLQQTRTALLDRLPARHHALLFGDGDGRFLARLLARQPGLQATAVDSSAAMLRLLQARCHRVAASAQLTTLHTSALRAQIPADTDLVVTHFFLDCLKQPEVEELAHKLASTLRPGTLWLLSDFAIPNTPGLRFAARLYVRFLYLAFRLLTGLRVQALPDPEAALTRCGFRSIARKTRLLGLLYNELWVLDPAGKTEGPSERHNPAVPGLIHTPMDQQLEAGGATAPEQTPNPYPADPLPNPEPIAPSLSEPDPGVFHHEPARPAAKPIDTV